MDNNHPNEGFILKVGDQVKNFTLPNTDGTLFSLSAVLERGPVVILFYRGDW